MDLASLEFLLRSENRSRRFLAAKCWGKGGRFCIRCRCARVYRLADKRYRCAICRYTFQDFSGRWIGKLNLSARQWLRILKLFELEVSTPTIAREVGISYPTALKVTQLIRCAIIQQSEDFAQFNDRVKISELYFAGRSKAPAPSTSEAAPVFGISDGVGRVRVSIVNNLTARSLLQSSVKTIKMGAIAYTDRFRNYDSVVFYGSRRLLVRFAKRFGRGDVYISRRRGFWNFAKKRLSQFQAVSRHSFPLYMKELEFRYNHRHESVFDALAFATGQLVPDRLVG